MTAMDAREYYCSLCEQECGHKAYFGGRWQKIHTTMLVDGKAMQLGDKRWLYLCRSCDFSSWRDFTKLEQFHDLEHRRSEYYNYLTEQLKLKEGRQFEDEDLEFEDVQCMQ